MDRNKYIDHTLLKPEATSAQIAKLCAEARENHFASVCVNPTWVALAAKELAGSDVDVCTVVGFPLGATTTAAKVAETRDAIGNGATEIDMVINIGRLKDNDDAFVKNELEEMRKATQGHVLKVIIETCLLTDEEKIRACRLCDEARVDFVKTSTGFSTGGATAKDVALMRQNVSECVKVKAAGGIRTKEAMEEMIAAGADRIGTINGVALVK